MRTATSILCCLLLLSGCAGKTGNTDEAGSTNKGGNTNKADKTSGPAAAPSPTDRLCADPDLNDKQVAFQGQGAYLAGYVLGTGGTTLILAPQASATGCSWLAWARREADAGYRVLAFDFHDEGRSQSADAAKNSGDVAAAAAYARATGARGVVLVGASRGGTAALVAASRIEPPVTAVISLSAPDEYGLESAVKAVPGLRVPVLYVAATGDSRYAADARALHDATPGDRSTLALVPGQLHGTALLTITAEGTAEAGHAVDGFLRTQAPPH